MKYQMKRPPMGWNSYDYYDTTVTEEQVKANAKFMATYMKEAGSGKRECGFHGRASEGVWLGVCGGGYSVVCQ